MIYNKLVRDKIPEIIHAKGGKPIIHVADDSEYWKKLKEKLIEEVEEFNASEAVEEIGDILEIVDAICAFKNITTAQRDDAKSKKFKERGGFTDKIILDES